ncbi:aminoglycoside phosphotransferase family protein [Micromonospora sp. WMMD812]|uniref:phosphotransferase family protein n=1 Tax=Micromonospora sp. WMMD812 TaxID=3015152 RepID=UPI00248B83C9|nr:aminoglycoside phosphotransferase family protein [Micromonospora sp. WMMD812]WBB68315.1 aminoglycoside phosphotransferase family protein [Micromonospora sp. WMMD812]
MNRPNPDEATRLLDRWTGGVEPRLLGQGMEGLVYEVDHDLVAKVWFSGSETSLVRTTTFYDALAGKPFDFAVPRILDIHLREGRCVTIERRLAGTTMTDQLAAGHRTLDEARRTVVDVLSDLAGSGPLPEARALSVLDDDVALYDAADDFPAALAALAARRVARFRRVLDPAVENLDKKVDALRGRLREIDSGRRSVIHGDLIPANILVDGAGRPAAVLDWGFLTTEGDPVFDAAVAASIFDMYGRSALETELGLHAQIEERLGYERDALLVYRAAYSVITANAYDADGEDGHFAWCVAALNRPDVVRALLG